MKLCKKTLSIILSIIMLVSCVNVCFEPIEASAAAPSTSQLQTAFRAITNTTDFSTGDGTLLNAAEVLWQWINSNASTSTATSTNGSYGNYTVTCYRNNSAYDLNNNAKSALNLSTYNSVIDKLIPKSGIVDDSQYKVSGVGYTKDDYSTVRGIGFNTDELNYLVTGTKSASVSVTADLTKTLLRLTLDQVPQTILLKVTYAYNHSSEGDYEARSSDSWLQRTWYWETSSWHYFSKKPTRTVNSSDTNAYKNLHAFNDHFIKNNLYKTSLKDLCDKSATEIANIINANNTAYAKLNSYSANVKNHFFPMSEVEAFMENCIFAQKVINAKPAIIALGGAMAAGYDVNDLSQMESIYTAQKPNLDYLSDKQDVITYLAENFDGYSTFSLEAATAFMNKLFDDIELYKIREIKAAIDALRAQYPDAEAIAKIDTDADGNYINDNLTLWTAYDMMVGYITALEGFETENVNAVFTEGTNYVYTFRAELKYEWDYRGAEEQYESYYAWFLPLIYKDLTAYATEEIINTGIPATTPNIPNATSKKSAYTTMYNKYTGLIGADAMKVIFGDGENSLGYIIDDYIARLYAVLLGRLTSEVDTALGYYNAYKEINLDNFVAVKEAIGRVETEIWDYINKNNPSIISSTLRTNYNKLWTILNEYNKFVASDGLAGFEQQHLHDANGVFITREPTEYDKARTEGEDYNVTEKLVLDTIKKLDAFLVSNDFTELVDIDQNPDKDILLDDFIKQSMSEVFYTNQFVNMLMNIVYPALASTLEDVYSGLPKSYDTGIWGINTINIKYNSLTSIINKTGIGIYPNQVDDFIANGYGTAKAQLSTASTWKALQDADGNLNLDWGIDSIKPENYSTTQAYLTAKKNKFLGAMAESFDAILPLVRVLLADRDDMELSADEAGSASKTYLGFTFSLNGDLVLNADGCPGYSDVVVPILEALGCTGIKSYSEVKNYTTSRQFVDAIFNPIINLVENKLASAPVDTIVSILPNLAYAIPFDKLWDLIDLLNIRIYYTVDDSILGIKVIDKEPIDVKFNSFLSKDSLPLEFDISSFSDTVKYLLSSMLPGIDFDKLPILNSGKFISHAKLNKSASSLSTDGKRLNFEADKADVFVEFLYYLTSCLGDEAFVEEIVNAFMPTDDGSSALTPELREIITNTYTNPDLAIAAIIELLNQTEYALEDYTWYDGSVGGTVEGITPATEVYLSSSNNWNKETADYVEANLNDILATILETAGSDLDISAEITNTVNSLFTNETLTSFAKALSGLSALPEKVLDIITNELGVDLSAFATYEELADDYNWGFENFDRDAFIENLLSVLSPLEPLYGFLLSGDSLTLFEDVNGQDLVTFYGNEGYDTSIVPLLEALGCDVMTASEFSKVASGDTLEVVINSLVAKLDEIAADPINEILDILPSLLYFIASDGLTTAARNLLHPVYVILDTLRPVYDIDLSEMISLPELENGTAIDIENLDVDFVVELLEDMTGLNLHRAKTIIYDVCKVVGTAYTSESSFLGDGKIGAYTEGKFDRADMLTVLISLLLELMEDEGNAAVFDEMLGTENITATLLAFFNGVDPETKSINWMYHFGENHDFTEGNFAAGITIEPTIYALTYPNNWTEESAEYVDANLDSIVSLLVNAIDENYTDLASLVKDSINIYTPENVQAIADMLKSLLESMDADLLKMAGVMIDADFDALATYTAPEAINGSADFVAALTDILATVPGLVDWLFFGEDFRFFTGTKTDENGEYLYNDIITIKGADGYKEGLAPILEALGCENIPDGTEENAVELALASLFNRVDKIFADPANELLEVLPNVIYFLNADGLSASVYNMLSAVYALADSLGALDIELDVDELLGFDISKLTFVDMVSYLEEETGLDLTPVMTIFYGLCVGTIQSYPSISGEYAYKMGYSDDFLRKDLITIIITVFLQVIENQDNAEILRELLGEDVYTTILNILNLKEFDMQEISYLYTEYADTDKTFSAIETSELYAGHEYGPLYTEEMAQYIADHIDQFIDNIIYLLGIQIDGMNIDSLKELLNSFVSGSVYNSDLAQKILDTILGFVAEIDALEGSEHIKALIKTSIGVDLDAWDNYTVVEFEDDRDMFSKTVCEILEPLYPVLEWALCNKDFTFFVDEEKNDIITLLGAEGYAYGIVPLLEAIGCENIISPEAYYAAAEADSDAMITTILDTLFDRIDVIMENPADEILEMLPQVIYFINSNGLDTCFKNALHAVYGILNAIEPLVQVDLYELINLPLDEVTFESLFQYAVDLIAEETGYELTLLDINTIAELTVGKLVTYTSANGETLYKMVYQSETAKAEMVTIVMRLLVTFLMTADNQENVIGILRDQFSMSADAEKYVRAFLKAIADCVVGTHLGMDKALATIYYVFYGVEIGVDETADGLKDVNSKWQERLKELGMSESREEATVGNLIADILDIALDDIVDSEGIAPNGFIRFFERLKEFFREIIDFFKELFG